MTAPEATATRPTTAPAPSWREAWAVYLQPRVLIVLMLGFSSGLPLALSGSTLLVWMRESGVDLGTIGLFALVGTPYTLKFLWAPLVDALHVPFFTRAFGRRRGWLVFSQLLLIGAILLLALTDPARSPLFVALGALLVATMSSTQDIVVDAFRVESLPESEQAAGMASYVAAYRIGMLVSTAGVLFIVSGFESTGIDASAAWMWGYVVMAALVLIGTVTALAATEPEQSARAEAATSSGDGVRARAACRDRSILGISHPQACLDGARVRGAVQVHRRVFRRDDRAVRDRHRLHPQRLCRYREGRRPRRDPDRRLCRRLRGAALFAGRKPVDRRRAAGGLQPRRSAWLAFVGINQWALAVAISAENFTGAIGTVIFVAYLSALCQNPLHTATQYALLTALAAVGRTYLSSGAGYVAEATGWPLFFVISVVVAVPSLILLAWLQQRGHFEAVGPVRV